MITEKKCPSCEKILPAESFAKNFTGKPWGRCLKCNPPRIESSGDPRTRYYVYILRRPDKEDPYSYKGEPFYIGKGSNGRAWGHRTEARRHKKKDRKTILINSLWKKKMDYEEEIFCSGLTSQEAHDLERQLISTYGVIDKGGSLTNRYFSKIIIPTKISLITKNIELKSLIIRRFGTQGACAKALGWYESKLSQIVKGWTPPEPDRKALAAALEIPVEKIFSL